MFRWRYLFVSFFVFLTVTNAAKAADRKKLLPPPDTGFNPSAEWEKREKLRRAVSLPKIFVAIGYGVSRRGIFRSSSAAISDPDQIAVRNQIAVSERELKGDVADADHYSRLSDLYSQAGQSVKAKGARAKAVELFRKQLEQHPDDAVIQLRLAELLDCIEKTEEAEALVRLAVKDHPNDWHSWLALGELLDFKSRRAIIGRKSLPFAGPETLLQGLREACPTPGKMAASQQLRREAVSCYDQAARLAPGEAEVYRRRGASRYHYDFLDCGLRLYKGEKVDFYDCVLGREALPDLRRAVELNPQDYKGIAFVNFVGIVAEAQDHPTPNRSAKEPDKLIDTLSQSARKRLLKDIVCLEKGIRDPNKDKAAEAAEVLGYLQLIVFGDYSAAEKCARRGIELDPTREIAWDVLVNSLAAAEDYQKLAAVCRERLEHKDSARNRLMLAKAYDHLHHIDQAEEVVRTGLQREPNDFMLRLSLADLLLMSKDHENAYKAGEILSKLHEEKLSDGWKGENRWINYTFTSGIYYGMIGQREQAQKWLRAVQKHNPKFSGLEDALKALEE